MTTPSECEMERKDLVLGYHFHGWTWKFNDGRLCFWAVPKCDPRYNPKTFQLNLPDGDGKWVRVKFVEVE